MCGIASIYAYHYASPPVNREELRTIRDHMTSRGPDGKGEWYSNDNRIALGHRRLSIIDLSDNAAQPMATEDKEIVVSFNGEIYNYRILRQKLEQKGYRFRTQSDTEVLLHLYAEKGENMVNDLRGMFAFTLWDANRKALFLARDPYGIKPLYYADDGWTVRIASQVKAIMAGGKVSKDPEPAGLVGFYLFGSVPEPYTTYQEVRALPAGSTLWIDQTGPSAPKQYFSIAQIFKEAENDQTRYNEQEAQQIIRDALLDSVQHHQIADVPVGAFLSAGIDSSALVGLMAESNTEHKNIKTICLAFDEYKNSHNDESPLARKVANKYETQHTTRYVTEEEFHEDLPKILEAMDQPTIDGINTWFVSKAAKEQGLKVAVSGLGGDELLGGYPSFKDIPGWVKMFAIPSRIPMLGKTARYLGNFLLKSQAHKINPKSLGLIEYGGTYEGAYLLRRGIFMPWELETILDKDLVVEGLKRLNPLNNIGATLTTAPNDSQINSNASRLVATMEASLYMRNQLLRDTDWTSMAHSLEVRVPLVDATLLKRVAPVLIKNHCFKNKTVLAKAPEQALPVEITNKSKTGFTTPIQEWLKKDSRINQWRDYPSLLSDSCPWARRWAMCLPHT